MKTSGTRRGGSGPKAQLPARSRSLRRRTDVRTCGGVADLRYRSPSARAEGLQKLQGVWGPIV